MTKARKITAALKSDVGGAHLIQVFGFEPLSGNKYLRLHRLERHKYNQNIAWILRSIYPRPPSIAYRVIVGYARSYRSRPLDEDNLIAGFKPVLDALVAQGVLEGDSPDKVQLGPPVQRPRGDGPPRFSVLLSPAPEG